MLSRRERCAADVPPCIAELGVASRPAFERCVPYVGIDLKAGQPLDIAWRAGILCFRGASRLVLCRIARPFLNERLARGLLHRETIGNRRLTAAWPDVKVGNATGSRSASGSLGKITADDAGEQDRGKYQNCWSAIHVHTPMLPSEHVRRSVSALAGFTRPGSSPLGAQGWTDGLICTTARSPRASTTRCGARYRRHRSICIVQLPNTLFASPEIWHYGIMIPITLEKAQQELPTLIQRVLAREEIVIGTPGAQVKLTPMTALPCDTASEPRTQELSWTRRSQRPTPRGAGIFRNTERRIVWRRRRSRCGVKLLLDTNAVL